MHNKKRNIISGFISTVLGIVLINFAFSSCERIYEDLAPCPHGVSLRFIYDYNMEYANAFAKKVDCLTLLVYDENGNYVDTRIVTGTELQDENYRMKLDLKQGNYHFVAYGGLACNKSSFLMKYTPGEGTGYTDLQVLSSGICQAFRIQFHLQIGISSSFSGCILHKERALITSQTKELAWFVLG